MIIEAICHQVGLFKKLITAGSKNLKGDFQGENKAAKR